MATETHHDCNENWHTEHSEHRRHAVCGVCGREVSEPFEGPSEVNWERPFETEERTS